MLLNRLFSGLLYITLVLVFTGCASPRAPTGGDKDELPPVLLEEESTPNQQVNFKEREILLTFDEWFTLKDVISQLVISPLMPKQPTVKQKGKSILIALPDSLKEETTYTINFGRSIADLNEGNVLENFSFVFSTGPVLDSVYISGRVMDSKSLKPMSDVLVMLHSIQEDSAVYKIKPEYISRSNKEGRWNFSNIRSDAFQVVALIDDNLNFLYDLQTEYFGWYDSTLLTNIPKIIVPDIMMFPKESRKAIRDVIHDTPGWIKVMVDGPKPLQKPSILPPIDNAVTAWTGDTIHFWYPPEINYQGSVVLADDTVKILLPKISKTEIHDFSITNLTGKLPPYGVAKLYLPVPVTLIDTSGISLMVDSMQQLPFTIHKDDEDGRLLLVKAPWKLNSNHLLTISPGAFQNAMGHVNDTIRISIQVADSDAFGDYTIKVNGLDSNLTYLLTLRSGDKEIINNSIHQKADTVFELNRLMPGKYQVEIVEDLNRNGFWDTGNYDLRRQAERKMIYELESLRAAWEVESVITWQK